MAITINKDIIKIGQRGGKTNLIVSYAGRGSYNEPSVMYFLPTKPLGRAVGDLATEEKEITDAVLADKFIKLDDKIIEFDHKILLDKWELVEWEEDDEPATDVTPGFDDGFVSPSGWVTVNYLGEAAQDVVEYEVVISQYPNTKNYLNPRMAAIIFSDSTGNKGILVKQGNGYMSIWQNYPYIKDSGIETRYEYRLNKGLQTIYRGISVALNDWSHPLPINIPRLCENTLETNRFIINDGWEDLGGTSAIDMYHGDELVETFYFCNDWSSKRLMYNKNTILNDPINHHLAPGMYVPFCIYNADDSNEFFVLADYGGGNVDEWHMGTPVYDFCSYTEIVPTGLKELVFYNLDFDELRLEYDATHCGPGYFIYRNRYGAWDVFLIEGNIYENDNYTRDNHSIGNMDNAWDTWVKVTNRISISKTYTASTGWLTDEQAEKLVYHLMGSPEVYYQPFGGNMVAVNLTDNQAEIKKFRNGRRLIQYNINFEESKTRRVNR